MTAAPFETVLVGLGQIGHTLARDRKMAEHYRWISHTQVLAAHAAFRWTAAVDPSPDARAAVKAEYPDVEVAASVEELDRSFDVAVIATPPEARRRVLDGLPGLRAVLCEKPLGATRGEGRAFLEAARRRNVLIQVDYFRRADRFLRRLAEGELVERIGPVQVGFATYGNGIWNNGVHLIDLVRMLTGDLEAPRRIGGTDAEPVFSARSARNGAYFFFAPLDFSHYREVGLDLWGTKGRLALMQEGLVQHFFPLRPHRALEKAREIASDEPLAHAPTLSDALYRMYDNLAEALRGEATLWSPGENALATEAIAADVTEGAKPE